MSHAVSFTKLVNTKDVNVNAELTRQIVTLFIRRITNFCVCLYMCVYVCISTIKDVVSYLRGLL